MSIINISLFDFLKKFGKISYWDGNEIGETFQRTEKWNDKEIPFKIYFLTYEFEFVGKVIITNNSHTIISRKDKNSYVCEDICFEKGGRFINNFNGKKIRFRLEYSWQSMSLMLLISIGKKKSSLFNIITLLKWKSGNDCTKDSIWKEESGIDGWFTIKDKQYIVNFGNIDIQKQWVNLLVTGIGLNGK